VINFDKIICTQEYLPNLKRYARILGPKGLMPNTKSGTLVSSDLIVHQVEQSKLGLIEFRVNPESFIQSKIGRRDFEDDKLGSNFDALMMALIDRKPEAIKGRYFLKGMIKTSMGPPLKLDLSKYSAIVA
jgi:large subunit ribosomal protein L1